LFSIILNGLEFAGGLRKSAVVGVTVSIQRRSIIATHGFILCEVQTPEMAILINLSSVLTEYRECGVTEQRNPAGMGTFCD